MSNKQQEKVVVLVVDDSASDRAIVGELVAGTGYEILFANDGRDALDQISTSSPDVVLTDLRMPELDGLELVAETRRRFGHIPVILMTGAGSEEIAAEALRVGAASYVNKCNLASDLSEVLEQVLETTGDHAPIELRSLFRRHESHFEFGYEHEGLATLVNYQQQCLAQLDFADEAELVRIGIALTEALTNALEHGNLELSSSLREAADGTYAQIRDERKGQLPYRDRKVRVVNRLTPSEAIFIVSDEGPGYDPSQLPDPTDPENLMKASGRGMLLIRTFMDEVRFNSSGNEITMIKRR